MLEPQTNIFTAGTPDRYRLVARPDGDKCVVSESFLVRSPRVEHDQPCLSEALRLSCACFVHQARISSPVLGETCSRYQSRANIAAEYRRLTPRRHGSLEFRLGRLHTDVAERGS